MLIKTIIAYTTTIYEDFPKIANWQEQRRDTSRKRKFFMVGEIFQVIKVATVFNNFDKAYDDTDNESEVVLILGKDYVGWMFLETHRLSDGSRFWCEVISQQQENQHKS